ncbi:hypothetical protein EYD45_14325 [Hyunsoonleella flava]|uniref:FAR-17a/AIG1-like protein n=1 Tax=Hyunsoonleella flava TaxID=2527939 RepID=A0A4Q9FAB2_9FLAO|nr:Pr6Pr family membrane protein [Hyunsoonleella flava]TBN00440.1 hypothetical protein EYD45_14325 [Hyunsoonleella flava]
MKKTILLILAILGWLTLIIRLYLRITEFDFSALESTIQFFSYFTILTNVLVTIYCTKQLLKKEEDKPSLFTKAETLTALTAFILIVGIVYHIALKPIWNPEGLTMILSEIHHTVVPLGALILWGLSVKTDVVALKILLKWLLYPIIYITFVLIRGSFSDFYPYPFLDVNALGIQSVLVNSFFLLVIMIVLLFIFYFLGNLVRKKLVTD